MKKALSYLLLQFYVIAVFGLTIDIVQCCGPASTDPSPAACSLCEEQRAEQDHCNTNDYCPMGLADGVPSCETTLLDFGKGSEDGVAVVEEATQPYASLSIKAMIVSVLTPDWFFASVPGGEALLYQPHAPPLPADLPLFIKHCIYRL